MEFNYPITRNPLQTPLTFSDLATKWIQCNGSSEEALRAQREETHLSSLDYSQKDLSVSVCHHEKLSWGKGAEMSWCAWGMLPCHGIAVLNQSGAAPVLKCVPIYSFTVHTLLHSALIQQVFVVVITKDFCTLWIYLNNQIIWWSTVGGNSMFFFPLHSA